MDQNKVEALHGIGYTIKSCCKSCTHGSFTYGESFGECDVNRYNHLKHDNPPEGRKLSIHAYGHCPKFEDAGVIPAMWIEFKE